MSISPHESSIYHGLSSWYERVFSPVFRSRIHDTIRSLDIPPGARVLEVGVGTGLSLEAYPSHAQVTAIDLSPSMLEHAQRKIDRNRWDHITLKTMDAMQLEFDDDAFDYVLAFHLVTVVPDSDRVMQELTRVCTPAGTLVIINHLRSERPWIAGMVDAVNPLTHMLGWRTTLSFDELVRPAPISVTKRYKTSSGSLFTVLIAKKETAPEQSSS